MALVEEDLAGEVGELDEIAVHENEMSDPGTNEALGQDTPQRPATDEGHAGTGESLLALRTEGSETDLAVETVVVAHGSEPT